MIFNVKQDKIEEIILNMRNVLDSVRKMLTKDADEVLQNPVFMLAIERVLHISIESIVDVGNYIIDGFIMRDPGSYLDIIDILDDEQVIPKEDISKLKDIIRLRKTLVHQYTDIQSEKLYQILLKEYVTLYRFGDHVQTYLDKELN